MQLGKDFAFEFARKIGTWRRHGEKELREFCAKLFSQEDLPCSSYDAGIMRSPALCTEFTKKVQNTMVQKRCT